MRTFTIDLPEEVYEAALTIPLEERRQAIADAIFATARNITKEEEPSKEDIAAIGRGLADMDAGRVHDGEQVFADIRERFGWTKK